MKNPWRTLETREIYRNPWIRLREDQVLRPSGEKGIYSVVETRLAVGVVALSTNDELMLIGQYRYPTANYSWEIVEGGSEVGETSLDTAKRELREEAGLIARYYELLTPKFELSNCHSNERAILYLAREFEECAPSPDPTEELRRQWKPLRDCLLLQDQGFFKDSLSLIALYKLRFRFGVYDGR